MGFEIERRFLVDRVPDLHGSEGTAIRQGYVVDDGRVHVRVRRQADGDRLTIKTSAALERVEVELPLDPADAEQLWELTDCARLEKTRHTVPLGATAPAAHLDVYAGALAGLVLVEVEFASTAAADAFEPPAWFGRELTGESTWSNAALARHGRPA